MSYDTRKKNDNDRQLRKRKRDEVARLAASGTLTTAIMCGIQKLLEERYNGSLKEAAKARSDIAFVAKHATEWLRDHDFDADSPIQRARLMHRMGDRSSDGDLARHPADSTAP